MSDSNPNNYRNITEYDFAILIWRYTVIRIEVTRTKMVRLHTLVVITICTVVVFL